MLAFLPPASLIGVPFSPFPFFLPEILPFSLGPSFASASLSLARRPSSQHPGQLPQLVRRLSPAHGDRQSRGRRRRAAEGAGRGRGEAEAPQRAWAEPGARAAPAISTPARRCCGASRDGGDKMALRAMRGPSLDYGGWDYKEGLNGGSPKDMSMSWNP